ncbi:MAG: S8 family peptidase [Nitrososphaerota archaeon]|jgi:hypothetical protein|nr:S8 family peptidase [Nitrososphaerota archaeon]
MGDKNLPIKIVQQKTIDNHKNQPGGGDPKCFGEVTPELQVEIAEKFEKILTHYDALFSENELIPAVGKITVKQEAIAKSHKPNDLCRECPIIGTKDLTEIYIKVNKKTITETINLIKNPPSEKFRANLTTVEDIQPITTVEKISKNLEQISTTTIFDTVKNKIKIKLFDFGNPTDNEQIMVYVKGKLAQCGLGKYEVITYGDKIKFITVKVNAYDDVVKIASINGVKSVDFFQTYSLPVDNFENTDLPTFLGNEYFDSETQIGIIDGGISDDNAFLKPYIVARETYVPKEYQNPNHATFIASTIQYGNELNKIKSNFLQRFKFVDIVAMPNGDEKFGPTDYIDEKELMEIIKESMDTYASSTKIWNLSLGLVDDICTETMSDLGIFLDYIQDTYNVQFFVSIGNLAPPLFRKWPAQKSIGERDRLISPADSVRAVTVGSIARHDSVNSIVKQNEPSPFSRRGPGANYIVKPDVVDYGGNFSNDFSINDLGIKGLDAQGKVIEDVGTSYSTPRVAQKFASIYDGMVEKNLLLAKAMLIHSARMNSRSLLDENQDNIKYFGFGIPSVNAQDILMCSEDEITLVFKNKIDQGLYWEMPDFPFPQSLIRDGKYYGEIGMTLVYAPPLDERYGKEYCRINIDASFGIYKRKGEKIDYRRFVPLENAWDKTFEQTKVEHGFKWSPVKSYYRSISEKGIAVGDGWKIRVNALPRNDFDFSVQEFVLIITLKDPDGNDIYSEVINGLRERGYVTNNLETRQQIRQR